jgi:transposase
VFRGDNEVTKVELFECIRRDHFRERKSIRKIAKERQLHRRQVRQAIENAIPPKRKTSTRSAPLFSEAIKAVIHGWLETDKKAPRKQQHTGRRIYERLVSEHQFEGAEPTVRKYLGDYRKRMGLNTKVFIPQVHLAGEEAEVDWYEAMVDFPQGRQKVQVFQMRACHSGREFHQAFFHQTQQAFLEAHVSAFAYFGGVFKVVRYDNLGSAVKKVLRGRKRIETERFIALRSHYLFEAQFCLPGIKGAHEKGGVEGGVGRFRRAHFVPVPVVADIHVLNATLLQDCAQDEQRVIYGKTSSVATAWVAELSCLLALPLTAFSTALVSTPTVNSKSLVCVCGNHYSVPVSLAGQSLEAQLHAKEVILLKGGHIVARHARCYAQHQTIAILEHYLPLLRHKPGALKGALALHQERQTTRWPTLYDKYWHTLTERLGAAPANVQMVEFLWFARDYPADVILSSLSQALHLGSCELDSLKLLVRQKQMPIHAASLSPESLGTLQQYERPPSTLDHYDHLLPRRTS